MDQKKMMISALVVVVVAIAAYFGHKYWKKDHYVPMPPGLQQMLQQKQRQWAVNWANWTPQQRAQNEQQLMQLVQQWPQQ
jgi:Tfp pilus assembly protein PilO